MEEKGFFEVLFDLSFTEFVTTKLIKFIYALGCVLSALGVLRSVIFGFRIGFGSGLLSLVLAPVFLLVAVILVRVWCEAIIALFRIAENTKRLADAQAPKAQ